MRHFLILAMVLLTAVGASSQTLSPVRQECLKKCSSEFHVRNNSLTPEYVVLEPESFSVNADSKYPIFRTLDPGVHLTLSQKSARLSPLEDHVFGFKLECDQYPCLVKINAIISLGKSAQNGVTVRLALPELIFVCETKAKGCRDEVRKAAGVPD